jgi:chromosome segregation ATPase
VEAIEDEYDALREIMKDNLNMGLKRLEIDDFKNSYSFIQIFDDIEHATEHSLTTAITLIEGLLSGDARKSMTIEEIKDLTQRLNELKQATVKLQNPFKVSRESFASISAEMEKLNFKNVGEYFEKLQNSIIQYYDALGKYEKKLEIIQALPQNWAAIYLPKELPESLLTDGASTVSVNEAIINALWGGMTPEEAAESYTQFRNALEEYKKQNEIVNSTISTDEQKTEATTKRAAAEATLTEIITKQASAQEANINTTKQGITSTNKQINEIKKRQQALLEEAEVYRKVGRELQQTFDGISKLNDALGGNILTNAIADTSNELIGLASNALAVDSELEAAAQTLTGFQKALNTVGSYANWISLAINVIASIISAIKSYDAEYMAERLDVIKDTIQDLSKESEKLSESFDKAFNIKRVHEFNESLKTKLRDRIKEAEAQLALASQIKDDDERKREMQEAEKAIEDATKALEDHLHNAFSKATNGILDDVLSATESFVDAWHSAFEETGDGLKGLEENFNEMLLSMIKRQAALQIAGNFIDNWKAELEKYLNEGDMRLTSEEANDWAQAVREQMPELSAQLEAFFDSFNGVIDTTSGSLSGLQKGISGITEDQADVLAAYWNSTRGYMAHIDSMFSSFVEKWNNVESNPIVSELKRQNMLISDIRDIFMSVTKGGHRMSGYGIKVFLN